MHWFPKGHYWSARALQQKLFLSPVRQHPAKPAASQAVPSPSMEYSQFLWRPRGALARRCHSMSWDIDCMKTTKLKHNLRSICSPHFAVLHFELLASHKQFTIQPIPRAEHHDLGCNLPWCWGQWLHVAVVIFCYYYINFPISMPFWTVCLIEHMPSLSREYHSSHVVHCRQNIV